MAQCATTALADAVPCPCVRGAHGRFGALGPVPGVVSLPFPPSRPACPALCVAGRPVPLSLTLARWYAIPRGLCLPRARSGCLSGSPRVPFACVCAHAPAASAPPPLGGVACAPHAHPALGASRAVPRGPCPPACPALVPCSVWRAWGGRSGPGSPLPGLGLCAPRQGGGRASPGGCLSLLRGASDVRPSPPPDCPPTGRSVGVHYPRAVGAGVWVWGPNAVPLACTPCGGCVPRGWRGAVPGGDAFHRCEGRLRSGAHPPPTARPLGGLLGSATHVLRARACGCGGPSQSPWPACPVGAACRGVGWRPSPGGVACHRCEGRLVSGAVPPPAARPLGRQPGFRDPCVPGAVGAGVGPSSGPSACALAGRRCSLWGWLKGVPGGVPSTVVRGV